jgi:hypothetical protein
MSTRLHKYICIYVRTAYQIAQQLTKHQHKATTNECHTVMHSIQLLSRSRLTPHQHTRVLRRRTDTGSQTRTSSRTTHYEIEPPAVSGHQPPPGRTQTSPGPGTILPGAPNPRRAFGHVHRPMGKGGGSRELHWGGRGCTSLDTGTAHH